MAAPLPAIGSLFPPHVMVEQEIPGAPASGLFPEEAALVARAVDRRRFELAAGRRCARRALGRLGIGPVAIPSAPDRSPVWPTGVVGSIAHTRGLCVAAVTLSSRVRSVGVDVEGDRRLRRRLWERIGTAAELRWLAEMPEPEAARLATVLFSAKECFYKWQYPVTRCYLGFGDVAVEVDLAACRFSATLLRDAGALTEGTEVEGRVIVAGGFVVSGLAL